MIAGWILAFLLQSVPAQPPSSPSGCHIFIDFEFIWTLEMVRTPQGGHTPILNIITFGDGQWDLRPSNVHLMNERGREAEIERFSIDTGVPDDPYYLRYLKVHGDSFIGMDLLGDFQGFELISKVAIDLEENRFQLDPIDCLSFSTLAQRINQINYDSPDIRQDFEVLGIPHHGKREVRRRFY